MKYCRRCGNGFGAKYLGAERTCAACLEQPGNTAFHVELPRFEPTPKPARGEMPPRAGRRVGLAVVLHSCSQSPVVAKVCFAGAVRLAGVVSARHRSGGA